VDAVVLDDGRVIACDTVVFTGDWIPDHELARHAGLALDAGTRGPCVDQRGRTSLSSVFAAGNLVHAAETADVAALGGQASAAAVVEYLRTGSWPPRVPVECAPPLAWVWPQALAIGAAAPRTLARVDAFVRGALAIVQDGRPLWRGRRRRFVPNRAIHGPASWIEAVEPAGGPVRWRLD
jgi:hypothetical protein